jgi:hypothetical protein
MSDYRVVSIRIREEIWQAFKNYVLSKYGQLHGYLGDEVSRALDYYLTHSASAHTQTFEHKLSKPNKRHIKLLTWIAQNYNDEITHIDIEKYVVENFGKDKRTKKSYINEFLIKFGFIRPKKALYGRNVIYEIDAQRIVSFLKRHIDEKEIEQLAVVENKKNGNESSVMQLAKTYVVERYEAGDSIDEIRERLEDFGLNFSKQFTRNFVRKALREVRE